MRAIRPTGGFRIAPPSKECFGVPVSSWPAIPNGRCMSAAAAGGGTAWTRRRKPEERPADLRGGQPVWARRSGIGVRLTASPRGAIVFAKYAMVALSPSSRGPRGHNPYQFRVSSDHVRKVDSYETGGYDKGNC